MVKSLRLKNIEMSERTCDDCPRSIGETVEKEVAEMQEEHAKIQDYSQYEKLKNEGDEIMRRIRTVGIACATCIDIIGTK
ncbi:MAG: hypothetical protein GY865_03750 [candidate division Zixibacteria bacterium]|nr:hypothetical protein [candidate division Zixibacteria bacterium]